MEANLLIPVMGALDRGNVQSEVNIKDHGWEFMEDGGIWAKGVTTDTNALDISSAYRNPPNSGGRLQVQCNHHNGCSMECFSLRAPLPRSRSVLKPMTSYI